MWPFKKKAKKAQGRKRAYAGAQFNRLTSGWVASGTSADSEIRGSLSALRDRSRQLSRDNDYVKGFLREVQNNVIGQGIPFQAQVRMERGQKLNESVNEMIEEAWHQWTRKSRCHVAGTLSFNDIERLIVRAVAQDGEVFVRMIFQKFGDSKVPFALEIIESDRVDDQKIGTSENGNDIRMGVEVDSWGRPVAYYVKSKHPGDFNMVGIARDKTATMRIPASEMIPLMVVERPGQTRAVPWIASAMIRLHHLAGYEEAEVIAARAGASIMAFIQTDQGELIGDAVQGEDRLTNFEPGKFGYLGPGEQVVVPDLHRPSGQFPTFNQAMLRGVAAGVGVSYESISKDYSQSNYSSSRLALIADRDNWRVLQNWIVQNFHQIVFEKWLDMAVLAGALPLKGFEMNPERFSSVKWMPRGWAWIDPAKEVAAYKEAIRGGLTTQTKVLAQEGEDIEELVEQRKREVELAESSGLVFDTDAKLNKYTAAPASSPDAPSDPGNA